MSAAMAHDEAALDALLRDVSLTPGGPDAEQCREKIAEALLTPKWRPEHAWMTHAAEYVARLTQALGAPSQL